MHERILEIYYNEMKTLEKCLNYFQEAIEEKIINQIDFSSEIKTSMGIFLRMLKIKTQIALDKEETNLVDYHHRAEHLQKLKKKLAEFCHGHVDIKT